jgi:hypothetical protein
MAIVTLGAPDRDEAGDTFDIKADFDLTSYTTAPGGIGRLISSYVPDPADTTFLQRLLGLLVGGPHSRQQEITHVKVIIVINERHLRVRGNWLNVGLLRHWIHTEIGHDGIAFVDVSTAQIPDPAAV